MADMRVTTYQEFRGVDFSTSPAVVSEDHASDMLNMYVGDDGIMQKRPGWHILHTFEDVYEFSETASYVPGDYVRYDYGKYICISNHTGAWNASHFCPNFSASASYSAGDYVRREKNIYKFINDHTGAWDEADVVYANPIRLPINGVHYVQYKPGFGMLFIHAGNRMFRTSFLDTCDDDIGLRGDVNQDGVITAADATYLLRYLAGKENFTLEQQILADYDGDGKITEKDAASILRWIIGLKYESSNGILSENYHEVTYQNGTPLTLANAKSVAFEHENNLYILDGSKYYRLVPYTQKNTYDTFEYEVYLNVYAEEVAGYIPTTGVNGHYEYEEPQTEEVTGDTIVEKQEVAAVALSNAGKAEFPSNAFPDKVVVSLTVGSSIIANAVTKSVVTYNGAKNIRFGSTYRVEYSGGTATVYGVTSGDSVKLKIDGAPDSIIGEETVVAQTTVTATTLNDKAEATFPALKPFGDTVYVTLRVNSSVILNDEPLTVTDNVADAGVHEIKYKNGSVIVTDLYAGDSVRLFIKEADYENTTIGEPGSDTNPGTWVKPEEDEARNLLQTRQIQTFSADGIHRAYYLRENNNDIEKVELYLWTRCKAVDGVDTPTQENISHVDAGTYNGIYYYYKYVWVNIPSNHATYPWTARDADSTTVQQNDISYSTRIYFSGTKPEAHKEGEPNIRVTFIPRKHSSAWAVAKDRGYIEKCTIATRYGYFNDNRYFLSGNPSYRNWDFMSAVDDPTYFPHDGWTKVGSDLTAIQGYLHYGSELAIIKEDNEQDATIYMRSAILTEDNNILFPVQQGAQGVGAISPYALSSLMDDPMFLAKEGVFAIEGTDASQLRNVPNRSFYVDPVLKNDITKSCVSVAWGNYFIVCNPVTGRCYVADARSTESKGGSYVYNWYVWDNIPATCFTIVGDRLFFGTADGRLCVFNTDWDNPKRWSDGGEFVDGSTVLHKWHPYDGGYPINAYYVTKRDHLAAMDFKKTMLNDGGVITLVPQEQSSASITVTTEKGEWFVDHIQTDSDEPSVVIPIRKRVKNFDSIQTRIENKEINEGLAILGVQYRYAITTNRR